MGILDKWMESLDYEYEISELCVRNKSPKASCENCINVCEIGAIVLVEGKPKISTDKCVECGECIVACPTQAIEGIIPKRTFVQNHLVAKSGNVPSVNELLIFHAKGVTSVLSVEEEWNSNWKERLNEANDLLQQLDKQPLSINRGALIAENDDSYTRRELFSLWGKEGKSFVKQVTPAKWRFNQTNLELSRYYPEFQFFDIMVDSGVCTLCKACEILCPKNCFHIAVESFNASAQTCSGCMLCIDLCPEKAITVQSQITKTKLKTLKTFTKSCGVCRKDFQTLREENEKCPNCTKRSEGYLRSDTC
jgi:ferredoxin